MCSAIRYPATSLPRYLATSPRYLATHLLTCSLLGSHELYKAKGHGETELHCSTKPYHYALENLIKQVQRCLLEEADKRPLDSDTGRETNQKLSMLAQMFTDQIDEQIIINQRLRPLVVPDWLRVQYEKLKQAVPAIGDVSSWALRSCDAFADEIHSNMKNMVSLAMLSKKINTFKTNLWPRTSWTQADKDRSMEGLIGGRLHAQELSIGLLLHDKNLQFITDAGMNPFDTLKKLKVNEQTFVEALTLSNNGHRKVLGILSKIFHPDKVSDTLDLLPRYLATLATCCYSANSLPRLIRRLTLTSHK